MSYYIPGLYVSFTFMSYIKRKYEAWWQKYTYILSTGLNAGIAFHQSSFSLLECIMLKDINWWGNTVMYEGMDGEYDRMVKCHRGCTRWLLWTKDRSFP